MGDVHVNVRVRARTCAHVIPNCSTEPVVVPHTSSLPYQTSFYTYGVYVHVSHPVLRSYFGQSVKTPTPEVTLSVLFEGDKRWYSHTFSAFWLRLEPGLHLILAKRPRRYDYTTFYLHFLGLPALLLDVYGLTVE